ncbi:MAG: TetR/AcrR family transcriptional regulator [Bryobacteraceae bacterium]
MKTRMKGGQRREAIIGVALRLFAEKGFRGVTTRELATAAGITEPILYQHFKTKRDLYAAIIESKAREGHPVVKRLQAYYEARDDRKFFGVLANAMLACYERDPEYMRLLLFSGLERHEMAQLFIDREIVDFYALVSSYIKRRIKDGDFQKLNPNVAARIFVGMVSHHGLVGLIFGDRFVKASRKKVIDSMVGVFLEGIRGS